MVSRITIMILFHIFLSLKLRPAEAQTTTWIKAGFWLNGSGFPISEINFDLYTHLICAFADVNSISFQLSVSSDDQSCSAFANIVKQMKPTITTLLSIGGGNANYSVFSTMVSNSSSRKSFIQSSIQVARRYGYEGLDLSWISASTSENMDNLGTLFQEWRVSVHSETRNSSQSELILTASVYYSPNKDSISFPIDSMRSNLDWVHVMAYDYHSPSNTKFTAAHAALYDPNSNVNTNFGIEGWINGGLPANKLVLSLPFYGYAWKLANPSDNGIGALATGAAIRVADGGAISFKDIKNYTQGAKILYNSTYVVNFCSIGLDWFGFDDVKSVRTKVSYARDKQLLGYVAWHISNDLNWELSLAAKEKGKRRKPLLVIIWTSIAAVILLMGVILYCARMRMLRSKMPMLKGDKAAADGDFNSNDPNLTAFSLDDIEKATDMFSVENKLGEGGYGPVYKGVLADGQEIAVKRLSKASNQGYHEFKNEVTLTAKLQHVNLVRLLGFCIDREEQMLIYEYMPNKSLDYYLFDPVRRLLLEWRKRVEIIEGITQGLLYLQEYSRLTIIHRDLKTSNILLDSEMKPKISDFGMAKIFTKAAQEENTDRIVGTLGYVPPEYIKKGLYSTKLDVYSFGVVLLQIISGKKNICIYGAEENLSLLEYAYELWKDGKGMEIMDSSLDDTLSTCKLMACMQIALLCVQEDSIDRPSMLEVASMLKNEIAILKLPKRPAFSTKRDEDTAKPGSQLQEYSVNEATISQMVGR